MSGGYLGSAPGGPDGTQRPHAGPVLSISDLSVIYGTPADHVRAVERVSLDLYAGEVVTSWRGCAGGRSRSCSRAR